MKKILVLGASSSRESINKTLAEYAAKQISNVEANVIDLNDYEMPIFSVDREAAKGIHTYAHKFKEEILSAHGIVLSLAEHNGAYSAAFKNVYDWVSRISFDVWEGKPMFLLATSPGEMGGRTVLEIAYNRFSRRNKNTIVTFSLPEFEKNFSKEDGILDENLKKDFESKLEEFKIALK